MQLLTKLASRQSLSSASSSSSSTIPTFNLYQCEPREGTLDLAEVEQFFPALRKSLEWSGISRASDGVHTKIGPNIRFLRYKPTPQAGAGQGSIDWSRILLANIGTEQTPSVSVTGTTAETRTGESSGWWSGLWKESSNVSETTSSAAEARRVEATRGAIMCLPKA
jgi:hypothetical protein